jgi:hypothetical protein
MSPSTSQTDGRPEPTSHDSCHHGATFESQIRNRRSGSGVNQQLMPHAYREGTGKEDQGWAPLDEGSVPPKPHEDGPDIMDATGQVAGEGGETYETSSM